MAADSTAPTNPTWLSWLPCVPAGQAAADIFAERCGGKIDGWCRKPASAERLRNEDRP
jgi:hypothetical protein